MQNDSKEIALQSPLSGMVGVKPQPVHAWDNVAPGWQEWWSVFEQGAQPVSDRLLSIAHVGVGNRVLDIATGIGEPAVSAARLVGSAGQVVAIDQSAGMLAIARKRVQNLGLNNITFLEKDAEQLDFGENTFEVGLCRWGLMFMGELVGTLDRIRRQLVPRGYFAAAVWSTSPKVPFMSLPMAVMAQILRLPSQPNEGGPFSLANRHALAQNFEQAGFVKMHSEIVTITMTFADAENYLHYLQAVSPTISKMLAPLPPEQQAQIWQTVGQVAHQRYAAPNGLLHIPGEAICIVGQKL